MNQMWEYCGKEYKVLKVVNHVFDEFRYRMHKTRLPFYIVEGLICNGNIRNLNLPCDRSCYFMWHEQWLEKSIGFKKSIGYQSSTDSSIQRLPKYLDENSERLLECQLTGIQDIAGKSSFINNIFQRMVRFLGDIKRRGVFYMKGLLASSHSTEVGKSEQKDPELNLQTGDRVRVKTRCEINKIVDRQKRSSGCAFARGMYFHCNQPYRVLKTISCFYDEAKQKVCKSKNMIILENVTCSGKFRLYPWRCDRNCFFFWKEKWLEKIAS